VYPAGYILSVFDVRKTEAYARWLDGLRDIRARARIQVRVERLAAGNAGDIKPVGEGVWELRIDKSTQAADIKTSLRLARNL
jgi:putative component of toxin-antitoxin plasmid stabilization module